ncbi:hypothetical protein SPFM20_00280 [Salmonella phage SPFM20]|nr:hypothetical protein SPFM20_00280 [Salmonella phage SPFM20]
MFDLRTLVAGQKVNIGGLPENTSDQCFGYEAAY